MMTINLLDEIISDEKTTPRQRINVEGSHTIESPEHALIARIHVLPEVTPGAKRPKVFGEYISPSQISKHARCQATYYFHYGMGLREPTNSALIFGSALHVGAEVYLTAKRTTNRSGVDFNHNAAKEAGIEAARMLIRSEVTSDMEWKKQWQNGPSETFESILEGVTYGTTMMADNVWQTMNPQAIENGYVIEWKDENVLPVLGYTDVIDKLESGEEIIRDLKSGKEKKAGDLRTDVALTFYAIARSIETGKTVNKISYESYARLKDPKYSRVDGELNENILARAYIRARSLSNSRKLILEKPQEYITLADDATKCVSCHYNKGGEYSVCARTFGAEAL